MQGGFGAGKGRGNGTGKGRNQGNLPGAGSTGSCVCPSCGAKVAHQKGVPCYSARCPQCGAGMMRES